MSSQKQHVFSQVPKATIPRSSFDRSFNYKTTVDAGWLYPIYCDEVLPGDTVSLRASLFGRLATPLKPTLDNIYCETFFFFVPNRIIWSQWEKFMGAQDNPGDSTDFQVPVIQTNSPIPTGHLYDYFGLPTGVPNVTANNLPARAYHLIWNEWFRDQNLQDSVPVPVESDGPDNWGNYDLLRRGKRHDYFTSCLPWPQKTENPVTVPLQGRAPVSAGDSSGILIKDPDAPVTGLNWYQIDTSGANAIRNTSALAESGGSMYAELQLATGFTINQLRQSFAIQKLFERDARGGTRYVESLRAHFGVTSPDFRHQRPEFLGGGHTRVQVNPVAQTAPSEVATPQGNLSAFGVVADSGHGFTKSFTEHGYIIGLVNFRADLSYQQGLRRMWSRRNRFDFFFPALSHLGEMAVLNKEIYYQGDPVVDDDVFGYQEAWGDYRYSPSLITGRMRSNTSGVASLDVWHLGQDFANLPTLSAEFIEDDPPIDRIIAVQSEPHFLLDVYFKQRWARPMPLYGVPGLIDHF